MCFVMHARAEDAGRDRERRECVRKRERGGERKEKKGGEKEKERERDRWYDHVNCVSPVTIFCLLFSECFRHLGTKN